jgi:hypothetical protein
MSPSLPASNCSGGPDEPPPGERLSGRRRTGCLVGGTVWVLCLLTFFVLYAVDEARVEEGGLSAFWFWLGLVLPPAAGYLVAIVATVRRPSRHFGQGMLIGLTMLLLAGFLVGVAVVLLDEQFTPC